MDPHQISEKYDYRQVSIDNIICFQHSLVQLYVQQPKLFFCLVLNMYPIVGATV